MGKCKMCGEEKRLCKAHLLSNGLRTAITDMQQPRASFITADIDTRIGQTRQNLEFDRNILCMVCDRQMGSFETGLINLVVLWKKEPARNFGLDISSTTMPTVIDVAPKTLLLGIAATILKFSYTTRYQDISLGKKYEDMLARCIQTGCLDDDTSKQFSVKIRGHPKIQNSLNEIMASAPAFYDYQGNLYFIFILPGIEIYAKIGNAEWERGLSHLGSISPSEDKLKVRLGPFEGSPHHLMLRRLQN